MKPQKKVGDLKGLLPGTLFSVKGILMMTTTDGASHLLKREVGLSIPTSDSPSGALPIIFVASKKEGDIAESLDLDWPTKRMGAAEVTLAHQLRGVLEKSTFDIGPQLIEDTRGWNQDKKPVVDRSLSQALYDDRLKKARSVTQEQKAIAAAAEEVDQEEVHSIDKTRGDEAVDKVRDNSLKKVDEQLVSLDSTRDLLGKVGVDADLKEALDKGVEGFSDYKKLRRKARQFPFGGK